MRADLLLLAVLFIAAHRIAFAQGAGETTSRDAQAARAAAGSGNWLVSETTSPVDYSPIVAATTSSRGGSDDATMQLSISCRAGRTEIVIAGPTVSRRGEYLISYRINDNPPVQLPAAPPSFGTGAAFGGDAVGLLQLLPDEGDFTVRLSKRAGMASEGHFQLSGLKTVREKVATACKWPHAFARQRN
jgi:hypothetical protein